MKEKIKAIITGDIVNARQVTPSKWQRKLRTELKRFGRRPGKYEIFREDMFQLEVSAKDALKAALIIKSGMKRNKNIDLRMSIGIGTLDFRKKSIIESNGQAYTLSREAFEQLNKRRIAINTPWSNFNREWNLHIKLASLTMDYWTCVSSEIIYEVLWDENLKQNEIAEKLDKTQSTISEGLSRAGFDEIKAMIKDYEEQIILRIEEHKLQMNQKNEE